MLSPEQTEDLVRHFGNRHAAARAVGVDPHTILRWLNPEEERARRRQNYAANRESREKNRERNRRYHAANREKRREQHRRWRAANQERARESSRRYRAANRERLLERNRDRYRRLKDEGLCVNCAKALAITEVFCWDCADKNNERNAWRA